MSNRKSPNNCVFEGCINKRVSHGYCGGHNAQVKKGKPLTKLKKLSPVDKTIDCLIGGCFKEIYTKGYCHPHYDQIRLHGKILPPPKNYKKNKIRCIGPNCKKLAVAKDMCQSHWMQNLRGYDLTEITHERKTLIGLFNESVLRGPEPDDCWLWMSAGSGKGYKIDDPTSGYGQLRAEKKSYMAHRWAYEHFKNWKLQPDDTLDHLCRKTRCCNPDHLEIVSGPENTKRRNIYWQLRSENERYREFLIREGYDPDLVLQRLL